MNVNNGKYSRKETSRKLLKEMTYLFVALYLFDMINYTGQGGIYPVISYVAIYSFGYAAFSDRAKLTNS